LRKNIFTKTVNICLLIIIVIAISIYVRMGPSSLSITDQWAESTILNNVQNNIGTQIRQQRPDLPEASINQMVQTEVNTFYETNKDEIDSQVQILSMQFKEELQNDDGFTHLLGIDEYLWYSYAKWYDTNGYFGTELVDGKPRFMLRGGRFGQEYYFVYPSYMIDLFHGLLKIFDHNRTVEQSAFYISIILMALTCIPAFFLGRKISGNVGGFFAATIIAVSSTIVGRTLVGAPESDGYTVLFLF
jgi:amino acid permease